MLKLFHAHEKESQAACELSPPRAYRWTVQAVVNRACKGYTEYTDVNDT